MRRRREWQFRGVPGGGLWQNEWLSIARSRLRPSQILCVQVAIARQMDLVLGKPTSPPTPGAVRTAAELRGRQVSRRGVAADFTVLAKLESHGDSFLGEFMA